MQLKGAYCVGEHFVDPQCVNKNNNNEFAHSKKIAQCGNSVIPYNSAHSGA